MSNKSKVREDFSDLIQGDELGKSEIRDAIDILQKYRLVKASSYGNGIRYIIAVEVLSVLTYY
jgi:hypothetical protein